MEENATQILSWITFIPFIAMWAVLFVPKQQMSIVKGIARRYANDLRPTDTLESATVASVDTNSLTVEVVAIDLMEMGGSGGRMPRRSHRVSVPLPRSCETAPAIEDAIVELIGALGLDGDGDLEPDSNAAPEFWI